MFFSRWPRCGSAGRRRLKNEHLAGSQVVLFKIADCRTEQPDLGGAFLLAIDYDLRVYRIGVDLAAMILGAPLAPACRLSADALVRAELRGFE
jgi:hypothetical protein